MWLFYIDYLFIDLPKNMLHRNIYIVIEILNDLYQDTFRIGIDFAHITYVVNV